MGVYDKMAQAGLVRSREGRILGGVCAGLGRRFDIDPWTARLLVVLLMVMLPGSPLLLYPILWILMPEEPVGVPAPPTT
jgi:phage shock protein PspC (stress-responsive transcriptional regulator)